MLRLQTTYLTSLLVVGFCATSQAAEPLANSSAIAQIKSRAHDSSLAYSREWLLMNHYRKRTIFSGYISEIDGKDYFLNRDGKTHPDRELEATLEAFAQPITKTHDEHAQCRYFGRRNFLFEKLSITEIPKINCPANETWKKQLDVVGASVIFASAYFGNPASMFGHTFLKLHSRSNKTDRDLLNYGVSFAANTGVDGGAGFAIRGLTGGYHAGYTLLPYHQTLKEYTNLEGRDVFEYNLNLTPAELDRMLDNLLEVQNTYFDYYFLDENCSYQILSLLEIARPSLSLTDKFVYFVIPADTVRWLMTTNGLVRDIKFRPSLATELYSTTEELTEEQKNLTLKLVEEESIPFKLAELSKDEQAKIYDGALRYVSLLAYDKPAEWQDQAFKLQTRRASLGVISPESHSTAPPRPEQGHDSSQVGLGYGVRDSDQFIEYTARAAYHHLLSDETGHLPNSQLEILRFSGRSYFDRGKTVLQDISIVDIIALSPWSAYFRPFSWRANFGFTRLADQPIDSSLAFTLNGGIGNAISLNRLQSIIWFSFLQMHSDIGPDIEKNARLGASAQTQILLKPFDWLRATGGVEYRNYFLGGEYKFTRAWGEAAISFNRNLELRGGYTRAGSVDEGKALLLEHFLF